MFVTPTNKQRNEIDCKPQVYAVTVRVPEAVERHCLPPFEARTPAMACEATLQTTSHAKMIS